METAPLDASFYKQALIVLAAAGVVIPLFHRLHISAVLGFMLVGIVVGPFGLASLTPHLPWLSAITISSPASIESIAHLGVVLLLFMIGLELSFERLRVMRRLVFGLGSLQVVLCAVVLAAGTILLGHSRISAVVIGLALAMSSTAVVIQVLSEEKRLNTATGRTSFAILLFQDLGCGTDTVRSRHLRPDNPRQHRGWVQPCCRPSANGCGRASRSRSLGIAPAIPKRGAHAQRRDVRSSVPLGGDRRRSRYGGRRSLDGPRRVDRRTATRLSHSKG